LNPESLPLKTLPGKEPMIGPHKRLKKGLSQHLIKDRNILSKMAKLSGIGKDDTVVEIGAGQGDFTRSLAERAGHVFAVELDSSFRQYLEPLEQEFGNLTIVYGDFLSIPLTRFVREGRLKVVGNIPYKITGPIVVKLIRERAVVDSAYLTMQKEIAVRITSKPCNRSYGGLSVVCQVFADVEILLGIHRKVFVPPPKVDSAFLAMRIREGERSTDNGLMGFIRTCFENKRKQLKYAFTKHYGEEARKGLYQRMNFSPLIRAEEIPPDTFKEMHRYLQESGAGIREEG
jgi:16S rRNA (adenine1518-N6/adenine1519-N6)-dimethyltransferase